jgi:hypothetical protein
LSFANGAPQVGSNYQSAQCKAKSWFVQLGKLETCMWAPTVLVESETVLVDNVKWLCASCHTSRLNGTDEHSELLLHRHHHQTCMLTVALISAACTTAAVARIAMEKTIGRCIILKIDPLP